MRESGRPLRHSEETIKNQPVDLCCKEDRVEQQDTDWTPEMRTKSIREQSRTIFTAEEVDALIAGAGPAGACAPIASARQDGNTRLTESAGCLGGMWTKCINIRNQGASGVRQRNSPRTI
jgi:alkyl hydroperoxide reductase subunit AhpF